MSTKTSDPKAIEVERVDISDVDRMGSILTSWGCLCRMDRNQDLSVFGNR